MIEIKENDAIKLINSNKQIKIFKNVIKKEVKV